MADQSNTPKHDTSPAPYPTPKKPQPQPTKGGI